MDILVEYMQPTTLREDATYYWQREHDSKPERVQHVHYAPCPAYVFIRDLVGQAWYRPRDEVFILTTEIV